MIDQTWLRRYRDAPHARHRLICLPHAGGSATFYHPVARALGPDVDVLAVQYPGRQDRRGEPFTETVTELADQVVAALATVPGLPLTFFGHSMGALVAFEVARRLETPVTGLFVSGRGAPSNTYSEDVHLLPDAGLLAELRKLDGTDARMFDDPDVVDMIMPVLRNDYRAVETYSYTPGPPLSCPVHAMVGDRDPKAGQAEAKGWAEHTTGEFTITEYAGGHFYLTNHLPAILAEITAHLTS